MSAIEDANRSFLAATTAEQQRAAALDWVVALVVQHEQDGSRDPTGRFLADALRDLDRGYLPNILRPVDVAVERGRTRGGRANARARAVAATMIAEESGLSSARANRFVAFWSGMTLKAVKRLRENIKDGRELEVASLVHEERQRWQTQMQQPDNPHELLLYLALTEVGHDRPFHKK